MNVFEDLIEELRDENLLEATVIDLSTAGSRRSAMSVDDDFDFEIDSDEPRSSSRSASAVDGESLEEGQGEVSEREFYRKRAVDEISSLQMVEHVLSGIEREHMKSVPASYDDLQAKNALHKFLQVDGDSTTSEYADAEFNLMRETEAWSSVLADRDVKISVANLRRFCENSRPPLSSQALLSLARFYRNAPFSELTRAKFEFVMTRLFSRETEGEKRRLLFAKADMIGHIRTLYANWASVALYSADDLSSRAKTLVAGFDEKISEADAAKTFDQLVKNDFFKKVHQFKEATGEMFFTPEVVAATIDCNTRIGNKFVDLIRLERDRANLESLEEKYGYAHDQEISDAAGKTVELVEVLKNLPDDEAGEPSEQQSEGQSAARTVATSRSVNLNRAPSSRWFGVNKWLLMTTILVASVSGGLYFWADQSATETSVAESASDVNLADTQVKDYVRSARSTPGTLYAITLPTWDQLDDDKKRALLQEALTHASKTGQKSVQFVNVRGRVEGYASNEKIDVLHP